MAAAPSPAALMKLRRFQKSDSSVISALGMSGGRRMSMWLSDKDKRERDQDERERDAPPHRTTTLKYVPGPETVPWSDRAYSALALVLVPLTLFGVPTSTDREGFEPSIRF